MAISVEQLGVHLRLTADAAVPLPAALETVLTELLASAKYLVDEAAPDAPDVLKDRATIQVAGYQYESPVAAVGSGYAAIMRNSGALSVLANHVVRQAVIIGAD